MKATTKVVSFGLNFNGQLGYECYDNKNPRSVNAPSDLISLHAGWNCSVAVNSEGTPYFWGTMPSKYDGKAKFLEPSPLPAISIGFKLAHRRMLMAPTTTAVEDGTAYSFGQGEWGKLGHGGAANEQHPKQLEVQGKVTQIGVGDQHSVLLTDGGHVYTFGQGIYGQLGHGTRKDLDRPKRVEALVRAQQTITSIGVGFDQTFAINADGVVHSWGRQGPWLGHAAQPDHVKQPQEVGLLKNKAKIMQVAAGKQHTLLLTIDGKVYSMGKNKDGCLGQGKTVKKETANPMPITSLNNYVITQVAAGEKHSVVLASDGSVLTFGSGSNGRLGHGDTKNQDVPRTVQGVFDKACAIAAGFEHTIVLTGQLPSPATDEKKTKKSKKSSGSSDLKSSKSSTKSKLSSKASSRKAGKGNYSGFNSSSEDSEDEGEEEEEEEDSKKSKKKSSKKKAIKGKLDPDLEAMLKELGLLEAAPVFIKAGITWTGDLDELGLDVGPRVAIANYLQTAKNKFKVGESGSIKATIESQDLVFHKKLGEGNFGDVWQGKLRGTTTVAIKTIRSEDKSAFLLEAHIMAQLPAHPNVVTFFGLSSCDEKNELFLVTEFVADGSLDRFLTENIGKIGTETLIQMTRDMAAGCDHLSTHGIVHRDLAARNLLLEIKRNGEHHVKVCDFGLSRGLIENEYNSQMKNVPVRWTAPEAFKYRKYTTKSDVWSFAVTLWEIFSFGQTPYTGMSPLQVVKALDSGYRLSRPEFCPKRLYDEIICKCLTFDPEARPTFNEIFKKLEELYPNGKISEAELQELRASREQQSVDDKLDHTTRDMFVVENEDQYDDTETGEYASEYNKSAGNGEAEVKAKQDKPKKPKKKKKEKDGGEDEAKTKTKKKKKTKTNGDDSSEMGKDKTKKDKPKKKKKPAENAAPKPGEYASGVSLEFQSQMEDSGHYLVDPPSPTTPPAKTTTAPSRLGMSHAEMENMTEYA
ncbi:protein kinase domain containing protein [Acanthamoeba castellanii str. Neff]|uniref:Protein kinase domain containing protein n=1 Tax=Acanthamoeba castellanii (strain ATCC 30010 / Neff) TaxID=1257118 RepID=L8H056_ACACF|nr:protein kinase domain containing protein [Acanthamoeba castellanii str. Neff]ELR17771.1 protein kinase domain containing protein [Acanthamoeba castellanii str. Neff]